MRKVRSSVFEHRTCGRCGGTGFYCHYGACFGCNGAGFKLTRRGAAAARMYHEALKVPARDVQVGQLIETTIGIPYPVVRHGFRPVTEIAFDTMRGASLRDGEMRPYVKGSIRISTAAEKDGSGGVGCTSVLSPGTMVRIATGAEQKKALVARCLAYQETLTASGTPRKRKAVTA